MFHLFIIPSLPTEPLATTDLFTASKALPFPEGHRVGTKQYVSSSDWLLSLSNMHSRFFHIFLWLDSSFVLFLNNISMYEWTPVCFPIHLLKNILAASNLGQLWIKAVLNIHMKVFLCGPKFSTHLSKNLGTQLLKGIVY